MAELVKEPTKQLRKKQTKASAKKRVSQPTELPSNEQVKQQTKVPTKVLSKVRSRVPSKVIVKPSAKSLDSFDAYGINILKSNHKIIRTLKSQDDQPEIHGNKLWGSSFLLMDYFDKHPPKKGSRVLEVGCGWGLTGIYFAKNHKAKVLSTDADAHVFPYLQAQAANNRVKIETQKRFFRQITKAQLAEFDILVGADICFWDELTDELFGLVKKAIGAGVKKIVIADPERSPFFDLAFRCMESYCADLESWRVYKPRRAAGTLLVIENA